MSRKRLLLGARGERIAERYLRRRGLLPAARNLRSRAGEIDLLMWDGPELVIVEVRTVQRLGSFDISDKIPLAKRRQLLRLAHQLEATLDEPLPPIRFDLCLVVMEPKREIEHLEDAFRPGDLG